jgi:hypothetical protein
MGASLEARRASCLGTQTAQGVSWWFLGLGTDQHKDFVAYRRNMKRAKPLKRYIIHPESKFKVRSLDSPGVGRGCTRTA